MTANVQLNGRKKLKDVCELIIDCEHKTAPVQEEGYPSIRTPNIGRGRLILDGVNRVSEETYQAWTKREVPKGGDLILAREAPVGNVAIIPENLKVCLGQRTVLIRANKRNVNNKYLLYLLLSDQMQGKLLGYSSGATVHHLNMRDIRNLELPELPDPTTQRKIAAIISAYDDLIETNQRRISLLGAMVATVYREWFVHFRFPGHEKVEMCQSPLGQIPKGWLGQFTDYVSFLEGPGLRKWEFQEEGIPFLVVRSLIDNDIDLSKVKYIDPELVRRKYSHFLLEPLDHMVSSSATLGRIVTIQSHHLPLLLNAGIIRMRPKTDAVGRWQLKHFLNSNYFQNQIRGYAVGVAQIHYGPSHLKRMLIVAPSDDIGKKYEALTAPIEELIAKLVKANTNLRQTRDLLLPKLISGGLDVEHLDINTEALDE